MSYLIKRTQFQLTHSPPTRISFITVLTTLYGSISNSTCIIFPENNIYQFFGKIFGECFFNSHTPSGGYSISPPAPRYCKIPTLANTNHYEEVLEIPSSSKEKESKRKN